MTVIYHIAEIARWQLAREKVYYSPASFTSDGFIHCSSATQVVGVANAFYRGQVGLVLLLIDTERVSAPIIYEDLYQSGAAFPHIYGPLPTAAVFAALPFAPDGDGYFTLPSWPDKEMEKN